MRTKMRAGRQHPTLRRYQRQSRIHPHKRFIVALCYFSTKLSSTSSREKRANERLKYRQPSYYRAQYYLLDRFSDRLSALKIFTLYEQYLNCKPLPQTQTLRRSSEIIIEDPRAILGAPVTGRTFNHLSKYASLDV